MLRQLHIFLLVTFGLSQNLLAQSMIEQLIDIESINSEMFAKNEGTNYNFLGVVNGLAYVAGDNLTADSSKVWVVDPWSFDRLGEVAMPVRTPKGRTRIEKVFGFEGKSYLLFTESLFGQKNIVVYFARITAGYTLTDSVRVSEIPSEYIFGFFHKQGTIDVLYSPDHSLFSIYFTIGKEAPYSRFVNFGSNLEKVNSGTYTLKTGKNLIIPEKFFLDNSGVIYGYGSYQENRRSHTHYPSMFKLLLDEVIIEPIPRLDHKSRAAIRYFKKSRNLNSSWYVIAENDTTLKASSAPGVIIADPYKPNNTIRFVLDFKTMQSLAAELEIEDYKTKKKKKKKASYIIQQDDSLVNAQRVTTINKEVKSKELFLNPIGIYNNSKGDFIVILSMEGRIAGINPKGKAEKLNYSGKILVVKVNQQGEVLGKRIIEREHLGKKVHSEEAIFIHNGLIYFLLHDAVMDELYSEMVDIHIQGIEDFSFQEDPGYTVIDQNNVFGPRMIRSRFYRIDEQDYVQFRGRLNAEDVIVKGYLSILHFND